MQSTENNNTKNIYSMILEQTAETKKKEAQSTKQILKEFVSAKKQLSELLKIHKQQKACINLLDFNIEKAKTELLEQQKMRQKIEKQFSEINSTWEGLLKNQ